MELIQGEHDPRDLDASDLVDAATLLGLSDGPIDERMVHAAFREKSKQSHPDAPSGSDSLFKLISAAKATVLEAIENGLRELEVGISHRRRLRAETLTFTIRISRSLIHKANELKSGRSLRLYTPGCGTLIHEDCPLVWIAEGSPSSTALVCESDGSPWDGETLYLAPIDCVVESVETASDTDYASIVLRPSADSAIEELQLLDRQLGETIATETLRESLISKTIKSTTLVERIDQVREPYYVENLDSLLKIASLTGSVLGMLCAVAGLVFPPDVDPI